MSGPQGRKQVTDPWWLAEFCCWTAVVLAPLLTWVNGASVSTDQFVVRTAVLVLAVCGAVCLRARNFIQKHRHRAA